MQVRVSQACTQPFRAGSAFAEIESHPKTSFRARSAGLVGAFRDQRLADETRREGLRSSPSGGGRARNDAGVESRRGARSIQMSSAFLPWTGNRTAPSSGPPGRRRPCRLWQGSKGAPAWMPVGRSRECIVDGCPRSSGTGPCGGQRLSTAEDALGRVEQRAITWPVRAWTVSGRLQGRLARRCGGGKRKLR